MMTNFSRIILLSVVFLLYVFAAQSQTNDNSNNKKQEAKNTDNSKQINKCPDSGTVRLRVAFDKSGTITKVEIVLSGGCKEFDDRAIKAVKEIKFEPAKKNGKPITTIKTLEYKFTID